MTTPTRLLISVGVGALAAASAAADVVNGGFELPGTGFRTVFAGQTYGSWTCAGPSDIEFVDAQQPGLVGSAYEGSYWIDLTGVGAPSGLYQDVVTVPGTPYEVSFAMAGNPFSGAQIMNMNVLWNGGVSGSFSHNTTGRSATDMGWTVYTVTVLGTGLDRLQFQGTSGHTAAGAALDAVSLRPVPAPGVGAMLGAAGLLLVRRKR